MRRHARASEAGEMILLQLPIELIELHATASSLGRLRHRVSHAAEIGAMQIHGFFRRV